MWRESTGILSAFPKRIVDPAKEPVSVDWLKSHLRFDIDNEDTLISDYIKATTSYYEELTRTAFITQTLEVKLNDFWPEYYMIPNWPIQEVLSVTYTKFDNSQSADIKNLFKIDLYSDPCWLTYHDGFGIDDLKDDFNVITIRYKAGFGDDETDVPEAIRQAIRLRASAFFGNRTDFEIDQMNSAADALIKPFKRIRVW